MADESITLDLATHILDLAADGARFIVAIAGPPGAGKSTLAEELRHAFEARGAAAAVVPMDGFHFDDRILSERGLLPRKGAPETFDVAGFAVLLKRLASGEADVAIPVFDRALEIARAGAAVVSSETRILLVEGNYLLLDQERWRDLADHFDLSVSIDVPMAELERRLVRRWLAHGHSPDQARERALFNDIPNARLVVEKSRPADITV